VLDTSAIIDLLRGGEEVKPIIESAEKTGNPVAATTVSLFELLSPVYHRRLHQEEKILRAFATRAVLLGLDRNAAEEASKIMGSLLRMGKPINALDALICGIAVSNAAEYVVTSDHDFQEVGKVSDIQIRLIR